MRFNNPKLATSLVSDFNSYLMAGSQLKNLKAALKAHNLTGQSNAKKSKKGSKRQPKQYDREEKSRIIAEIREEFNPFEVKAARNKRGTSTTGSTGSRIAVGKPGISKQIGEEQRKQLFEAKRTQKNRYGNFVDRRFGEKNKTLTEEDKMLERFTRERQSQAKGKNNLFDLNDNDEENDMFGGKLTHLGESLPLEEDFDSGDLGLENENGEDGTYAKRDRYSEEGNDLGEEVGPRRKKTKAEVMKEVIAKSKFYKQERQKAQEKMEDQIDDLDDDFDDIISELHTSMPKSVISNTDESNDAVNREYDIKVKELTMQRRAAPSDRTKTEEELREEAEEKKKKLEQQRLDRMSGIVEAENGEEKGVEDLDDEFWANEDEDEEGEGMNEGIADSDDDVELDEESSDGTNDKPRTLTDKISQLPFPSNIEEFLSILENSPLSDHPKIVRKIINCYQPKLAEGNKERLGSFTGILLRYILFLSDQNYSSNVDEFATVQSSLMSTLKSMSEKYNQSLSDECRKIINEMQERFKSNQFSGLSSSDLVFFTLVGSLFSTSDQYHLVVTPCSILISEFLEQLKFNTIPKLAFGAILTRISLQYQRMAKRYVPELTYFFEKSLATLLSNSNNDDMVNIKLDSYNLGVAQTIDFSKSVSFTLHIHEIFEAGEIGNDLEIPLLLNILDSLETAVSLIWKELPALSEITLKIKVLLNKYSRDYPTLKLPQQILNKIERFQKFNEHIPLTLQNHRPVSIPSHAPKFEENFNPDRKSYDPDRSRSEVNKMKNLLKKERKFTMKEIRKDTRFDARKRIEGQKSAASEYHAKMSQIINTISTEEGAEKNKYEREKKLRSGKK